MPRAGVKCGRLLPTANMVGHRGHIMGEPDYYAILGVDRFASAEQMKQAYHELAKKFHPDLNSRTTPLGTTFRGIARAYAVLSDPIRRAAYDATLPTINTLPWARDPAPPPPTPEEFRREYTGRRPRDPAPAPSVSAAFRRGYSGPSARQRTAGRSLKMLALGTGILVIALGTPAFVTEFEQGYRGGDCSFSHDHVRYSFTAACNERIEDRASAPYGDRFRGAP
jgi:hypothetical protein